MKQVLFVSNNLGQGGKERQIHELLKYFDTLPDHRFGLLLREPLQSYDLSGLTNVCTFVPETRLGAFAFIRFGKTVIKDFNPGVVHTWESGSAFLICIVVRLFFSSVKVIDGTLRYSKTFPKNSKRYWVARLARQFSDRVVANSQAGLNSIDYVKGDKFQVIPNGIDFDRFETNEKKSENRVLTIGMVASFSKPKDFALLVNCCLEIGKTKKIEVLLIGDGPERQEVEKMIPGDSKDIFKFKGNMRQPESTIATFDIAVLLSKPGHSEGLSNSIMEYMAAGLPVVCTRTGGNTELVKDGENGFLVAHGNLTQLTEKLLQLIESGLLRKRMGTASRQIALREFGIKRAADSYLALYNND